MQLLLPRIFLLTEIFIKYKLVDKSKTSILKGEGIDLIDKINPFQRAYEIMSKKVDSKILKLIQESIDASKSTITQAEATFYWKDVNKFYKENGREPNKNSNDEFERKLAEVLLYVKNFKRKQASK